MRHDSRTTLPDPPKLDVDPFDIETLGDPRAFQTQLRDVGPVAYIPRYEMYAVGRHAEAHQVLSDVERFTSTGGIGLSDIRKPGSWRSPSPITEIDPPQHTVVRNTLQRILSPRLIRDAKAGFERKADEIVAEALAKGECDGVADLAEPFVLGVFPDLVGVDLPRRHFLDIGELNFNQLGPYNALTRAAEDSCRHILPAYDRAVRRESVYPGGIGAQIYEAEDAGGFVAGTAAPHVRSFLRAGVDTTIAGLGHALHLLATHPDQWAKLQAAPAAAMKAFDEAIRLGSPSQVMWRTTRDETELSGFRLRGDVKIGAFLGAANRDARRFADPDRFDIDRNSAGEHLALGAGPHICVGQMIARTEAAALLNALTRQTDGLRLAGEAAYRHINTLRTLRTLPLRLMPR